MSAEESSFVYVNLNVFPVAINGPYGGSITVARNKAVKGEYFARFAKPAGSLTMIEESLVAPSCIVFEATPRNGEVAATWAADKVQADPVQGSGVPPSMAPATAAPVVDPDPAPAEEPAEDSSTEEADPEPEPDAAPAPAKKKKSKK